MILKNELCDMNMNDDESITSYFVRISQLRDHLIEGVGKHITQWSSQDVECICYKNEHKKGVSDI
jgi:hypothetical protein